MHKAIKDKYPVLYECGQKPDSLKFSSTKDIASAPNQYSNSLIRHDKYQSGAAIKRYKLTTKHVDNAKRDFL